MPVAIPPPAPRKQHTVSQVLLRRFTTDGLLEALSLAHPRSGWRRYSPAAVGYAKDFVRADAAVVEQVWSAVEETLPDALRALDRGEPIEPGGVTERALRDCLALHWARSLPVRTAADNAWTRVRARSHADLATRPELLDLSFRQLTGLHPAGPEARAIANDLLHAGPEEVISGEHFARRVVEFFHRAQERLAEYRIAVYDVAPEADALVLSDSPVITPNKDRTGWGPGHVALDDAVAFTMPLGPRLAVSIHDVSIRQTISATEVDELNRLQRRVATNHLYRQPQGR